MTGNLTVTSKLKISTVLILCLGGIGALVLCYYLTATSLKSEYPQIAGLILGTLFGFFGIACLIALFKLDLLELDNEKLIIKSILNYPKKTIFLSEITSFNEIEKENKSGKWKDLTIFTPHSKYKISSSIVSNYSEFKSILTKGKSRNIHSEKLWQYKTTKYFGLAFVILGPLFLMGMWNRYNDKDQEIQSYQLTTIVGTVHYELKTDRDKSSRSINIEIEEYPGFRFKLDGNSFHASNSDSLLSFVNKGAKIEIDILTDIYQKKLAKTKEPSFWDKTVNYNFIGIYGLRDKARSYLSLTDFNREYKEDSTSWGFWIFVLVGVGITGSGIYLLTMIKRPIRQ